MTKLTIVVKLWGGVFLLTSKPLKYCLEYLEV
jgi:hypothetical protein